MADGVRCMKVRAYDEAHGLDKTVPTGAARPGSLKGFLEGDGNIARRLRQHFDFDTQN
jgi:hypothetical protein